MSWTCAFLVWISFVHLICSGRAILVPSKLDASYKCDSEVVEPKSPPDLGASGSFNVFRGLYPPVGSAHPHPDHDYPFPQPHPHPPAPTQPPSPCGCGLGSQPTYVVLPISNQLSSQPKVKHTIKTVITDVKEVTTSLNDGSYARSLNLSLNGGLKSTNKEQEVQVVLPTPTEVYTSDDGIDLPILRDLSGLGLDPIELEENFIPGGQDKALLFRPYGVFKPAAAATLSAPLRVTSPPSGVQRHLNFPPFNLAYLRPRPGAPKEDLQQWRPSVEQPFVVHARPANAVVVGAQKSASASPCADEPESEGKEPKIDSKGDSRR
ncbi:uncharacterized protein [Bemisia tabaci]|uniref:uncharacterized protein n=1 Tax=Bemisia tabaci TaxID=7038 RepID=UPI003B28678A